MRAQIIEGDEVPPGDRLGERALADLPSADNRHDPELFERVPQPRRE